MTKEKIFKNYLEDTTWYDMNSDGEILDDYVFKDFALTQFFMRKMIYIIDVYGCDISMADIITWIGYIIIEFNPSAKIKNPSCIAYSFGWSSSENLENIFKFDYDKNRNGFILTTTKPHFVSKV